MRKIVLRYFNLAQCVPSTDICDLTSDICLFLQFLELQMYEVSSVIRQKANWLEKSRDQEIRTKWIQEIREQEKKEEVAEVHLLSDRMINYVLDELVDHDRIMKETNGLQVGSPFKVCTAYLYIVH